MVKKLAALAGAGAILLSVAGAAFAYNMHPMFGSSDVAMVYNNATAVANTGGNGQGNGVSVNKACVGTVNVSGNNTMRTGNAEAYAGALVVANTHVGCCPKPPCGYPCGGYGMGNQGGSHSDFAWVTNGALAEAYTGDNGQGNIVTAHMAHVSGINVSGANSLTTGNAKDTARAWTIVNTHLEF